MNRQVELLKGGFSEVDVKEEKVEAEKTETFEKPVVTPEPVKVQFVDEPVSQPQLKVNYAPVQKEEKKDFEKTIGKSLMGVFASVLIFISLILFATIMLPYFDDTAKMVTTYVVSFAFLAVGLIKLRKKRNNKFYMALAACGVGALYISLLLSNMYFEAVDDITLYILIALWSIGVCFLCRIQASLFQVIGHIGVFISVILGCVLCASEGDEIKFIVLLIYYFVTSGVFFATHPERKISKNLIFHIFNALNYMVILPFACFIFGKGFSVALFVLLIFLVINIGLLMWSKTEKYGLSFGFLSSIYLLQFWGVLQCLLEEQDQNISSVILFVVALLVLFVFELKKIDGNAGKYIPQAWILCMAMSALYLGGEAAADCTFVPLLVLPVLFVGFFRKNTLFQYGSLFLVFWYLFQDAEYQSLHFVFALIAVVIMYVMLYVMREHYRALYKYLLHTVTIFVFLVAFTEMMWEGLDLFDILESANVVFALTYTIIAVFNLAMMKTCFGTNLKTGEKENPAYHNFVNMIIMIAGLVGISSGENDFWHVLVILVTIVAFMVNAKNLLDKTGNIFGGLYVGFKFTILMINILSSFSAENYVISIACFVMAIVSIVIGFVCSYKALRLFGLILSMISTFKLIMVDITYENTLGHAVSFFISGILCFIISLIYNFIDGKIRKGE